MKKIYQDVDIARHNLYKILNIINVKYISDIILGCVLNILTKKIKYARERTPRIWVPGSDRSRTRVKFWSAFASNSSISLQYVFSLTFPTASLNGGSKGSEGGL